MIAPNSEQIRDELQRFALRDELDFVFYLQQGRPLFAMQLFLRTKGSSGSSGSRGGGLSSDDMCRIHDSVLREPMSDRCVWCVCLWKGVRESACVNE